jgi:hypothetical protein
MQELNYTQLQAAGSIDPTRIQQVPQSMALCLRVLNAAVHLFIFSASISYFGDIM